MFRFGLLLRRVDIPVLCGVVTKIVQPFSTMLPYYEVRNLDGDNVGGEEGDFEVVLPDPLDFDGLIGACVRHVEVWNLADRLQIPQDAATAVKKEVVALIRRHERSTVSLTGGLVGRLGAVDEILIPLQAKLAHSRFGEVSGEWPEDRVMNFLELVRCSLILMSLGPGVEGSVVVSGLIRSGDSEGFYVISQAGRQHFVESREEPKTTEIGGAPVWRG